MSEREHTEQEQHPNPVYHFILELSNQRSTDILYIGQNGNPRPEIDLTHGIGFKSQVGEKEALINLANKTIQITPEAIGKTYVNGQLLERDKQAVIEDGSFINIDDVQLTVRYVDITGTGKPYYLQPIVQGKTPDWYYYNPSHEPQTPWNPDGYSVLDRVFSPEVQKEVPVWMIYVAKHSHRLWGIPFHEVIAILEDSDRQAREQIAQGEQIKNDWHDRIMEWVNMKNRRQEARRLYRCEENALKYNATLVGVLGRRTGAGATEYAVFQRQDGSHFVFVPNEDRSGEEIKEVTINPRGYYWDLRTYISLQHLEEVWKELHPTEDG